MSIDLKALLRLRKPAKRRAQLTPRPPSELVSAQDFLDRGGAARLVPDTTVYIALAAGRLPASALTLYGRAIAFHCSVCIGEIAVGLGNRDPTHPGAPEAESYFSALFAAIPASRLLWPDASLWTDAGLIAGILARTQGFQPEQRKACLNDALIYLTAAKAALPVLTANRVDFDLIQQIAPLGTFVHY